MYGWISARLITIIIVINIVLLPVSVIGTVSQYKNDSIEDKKSILTLSLPGGPISMATAILI